MPRPQLTCTHAGQITLARNGAKSPVDSNIDFMPFLEGILSKPDTGRSRLRLGSVLFLELLETT
jgi:hypothetical protein